MFKNVKEAINWVISQTKFREKTNLDIMKIAYQDLSLDMSFVKKIHVAGTNGKGSTTAFITQILTDNNIKVGTFTSPYLIVFNERLRINNENINNNELLKYINYFYDFNNDLYKNHKIKLSFFEILTLMAFKYFIDSKVDVIVMEVGIGGRLDATNIINYDVSLITSIGFDHMQQLGNTLENIASEKIGILKTGGYLISAVDQPLKNDFINYANKIKAKFKFIKKRDIFPISQKTFSYLGNIYKLSLLGDYQRTNALIASQAVRYLFDIDLKNILPSLNKTTWAGRFEEIYEDVYIDGAHNLSAMKSLVKNINYLFYNKKITILFSALKNKDIDSMLKELKTISNNIILTTFNDPRAQSLENYTDKDITYKKGGINIFKELINNKKDDEIIVATGSLHFIGYLKANN